MDENKELQLLDENNAQEIIKQKIFIIRGQKVMLDKDLAELYEVSIGRLNEQVKRNTERFPSDFMVQLTDEEYKNLRSQFAISSSRHGGRRYLPYAFTEHGVAMLSSVLNSKRAIQMNIFIIRAFIRIRESLDGYKDLAVKVGTIEINQIKDHKILEELYFEIKQLTDRPIKPKGKIGFVIKE